MSLYIEANAILCAFIISLLFVDVLEKRAMGLEISLANLIGLGIFMIFFIIELLYIYKEELNNERKQSR